MIQVIGNIFGTSGYAIHSRSLANALNRVADVSLATQLFPGWETQVNDDELKMIKEQKPADINIIIDLPINWKLNTTAKYNIGFLVWEGDKVPAHFIEEIKNPDIDMIFVPSKHTENAILNTVGLTQETKHQDSFFNKVKVIPHGVDSKVYSYSGTRESPFTFLCNKGYRGKYDRGGIQYAIDAFQKEFKDEAKLILKVNPAYPMGEMPKNPNIEIITDKLTDQQMNELYNRCDVFLSPTRAEAFNLPCIEAMACGKPVITSNFGGQTDFVNKENGWLVEGKLEEVQHDIMYEGIKWFTPDINDLRKKMREATNPQIVQNKRPMALQTAQNMSWDKTAKLIIETFKNAKFID